MVEFCRWTNAHVDCSQPHHNHWLSRPWWNFVVGLMPMWIAPNLITIIGLAVNVFTSVIHLYYCPTATEEVPMWVPLSCALGLFIYQTLDAIDGKQARRTKSSNALGELFDHGCDSMSTIFVTLAGACSMGMGQTHSVFHDVSMFHGFNIVLSGTLANLRHGPNEIWKIRRDRGTNLYDVHDVNNGFIWYQLLELAPFRIHAFEVDPFAFCNHSQLFVSSYNYKQYTLWWCWKKWVLSCGYQCHRSYSTIGLFFGTCYLYRSQFEGTDI